MMLQQLNLQELSKPNKFSSIELFNMKRKQGSCKCNAFGIRYVFQNKEFDNLILMDGDGEDRPEEIKSLIEKDKRKSKLISCRKKS